MLTFLQACADWCREFSSCAGWTRSPNSGYCWLMKSTSCQGSYSGWVAGERCFWDIGLMIWWMMTNCLLFLRNNHALCTFIFWNLHKIFLTFISFFAALGRLSFEKKSCEFLQLGLRWGSSKNVDIFTTFFFACSNVLSRKRGELKLKRWMLIKVDWRIKLIDD